MKLKLNRYILKLILAILAAVLAVSLVFVLLQTWEQKYDADLAAEAGVSQDGPDRTPGAGAVEDTDEDPYGDADGESSQIYRDGQWYQLNPDLETVLLIGLDKTEEEVPAVEGAITNGMRSDFLLLLLLDHEKKTCRAVHINRDTMAEVQKTGFNGTAIGTEEMQLALAHTYGTGGTDSGENTVKAVSGFLYGVPIDHFVSVTMDAVPAVTDLAGGVSLEIMDDLTSEDPSLKEGAITCLDGERALKYVRARKGLEDSTNVRRMERQRQFIEALQETCREQIREEKLTESDVILTVTPYMVTDCTAEDLERIGTCVTQYEDKGIDTIKGESVKGEKYMEFRADEETLKSMVLGLFYVPVE